MANAIQHVRRVPTPGGLAALWYCPFCNPRAPFLVRVPKGRARVGRGYGLAASNMARAEVARHIHEQHADCLAPLATSPGRG